MVRQHHLSLTTLKDRLSNWLAILYNITNNEKQFLPQLDPPRNRVEKPSPRWPAGGTL
jgi:hypothetical protein